MRPSAFVLAFVCAAACANIATAQQRVPAAPRGDSADTYFGTRVVDPYRWLERYDSTSVRAWYAAEDSLAIAFLNATPAYARFLASFGAARRARSYALSQVTELPGRIFYFKTMPDEQSPTLYTRDVYSTAERRIIGPADLGGVASTSLAGYSVAPGNALIAIDYSAAGSERTSTVIVNAETGSILAGETLPRTAGVTWLPDGRSFLYSTFRDLPHDAVPSAVYGGLPIMHHVIGADHARDRLVFDPIRQTGDTLAVAWASLTKGTGVVMVPVFHEGHARTREAFIASEVGLGTAAPIAWRRVTTLADSVQNVFVRGPWLYGSAFRNAPDGRLVRIPFAAGLLDGTETADWSRAQVVLERPGFVLFNAQSAPAFAVDAVYWLTTEDGGQRLWRFPFDGGETEEIKPPFEGSYGGLTSQEGETGITFVFGGWLQGDRNFRYDPGTRRITELPALRNPPNPFDHLDGLTVETVMALSHDGVNVPLTILRRSGRQGPQPTILYGYSGYGYTEDAYFRAHIRPWLDEGGTYAICHARGGGYYGRAWYEAGKQGTKPNTWKDAIACGEYLVKAGLTTSKMLGINGGSAGGIFAGRAITERPDLFGAAVIEVGVSDMVRMHLTNSGPGNMHEFGSPDTEAGFRSLLAMSTYHHVQSGTRYPATLLYAGYSDGRVAPWHPAKLMAAMRHAGGADALPQGARPVLLRVNFEAGHAGGSVAATEGRMAMTLAFFAARLGLN